MADVIRVKRGLKANLPPLATGEFGYCTDTKQLYIGGADKNDLVSEVPKWTNGLTVNIFGDSLSLPGTNYWPQIFANRMGFANINNHSVGGDVFTGPTGWVEKIKTITDPADVIIVALGTNDWNLQKPIGIPTSGLNTDFSFAVKSMFDQIASKWGRRRVFVCGPLKRTLAGGRGIPFGMYAQIIYNYCQAYNFTFIDWGQAYNLNPYTSPQKTTYFNADGLHLTELGQARLADFMVDAVTAGIPMPLSSLNTVTKTNIITPATGITVASQTFSITNNIATLMVTLDGVAIPAAPTVTTPFTLNSIGANSPGNMVVNVYTNASGVSVSGYIINNTFTLITDSASSTSGRVFVTATYPLIPSFIVPFAITD